MTSAIPHCMLACDFHNRRITRTWSGTVKPSWLKLGVDITFMGCTRDFNCLSQEIGHKGSSGSSLPRPVLLEIRGPSLCCITTQRSLWRRSGAAKVFMLLIKEVPSTRPTRPPSYGLGFDHGCVKERGQHMTWCNRQWMVMEA